MSENKKKKMLDLRHDEPHYNITSTLEGKSGYARYTLKDGVYEDYDNSSNSSSN